MTAARSVTGVAAAVLLVAGIVVGSRLALTDNALPPLQLDLAGLRSRLAAPGLPDPPPRLRRPPASLVAWQKWVRHRQLPQLPAHHILARAFRGFLDRRRTGGRHGVAAASDPGMGRRHDRAGSTCAGARQGARVRPERHAIHARGARRGASQDHPRPGERARDQSGQRLARRHGAKDDIGMGRWDVARDEERRARVTAASQTNIPALSSSGFAAAGRQVA